MKKKPVKNSQTIFKKFVLNITLKIMTYKYMFTKSCGKFQLLCAMVTG